MHGLQQARGHSASECAAAQNSIKPSKPITPFELIDSVTGNVGELSVRIAALADKLIGGYPAEDSTKGAPSRPGHLGALADRADSIDHAVQTMHQHLNRIEAQLP